MATVNEIIAEAMEEAGVLALGETPDAVEAARALVRLQAMYRSAVDHAYFGRVTEYVATKNYTAKEQDRVYSSGFTITLPTSIVDDYTGLARRPLDLAMIQVVNAGASPQISIYDAHIASWVRLDNLTLVGEAPLSNRNRQGLISALARAISPLFMKDARNQTQAYAAAFASFLSFRASAPRQTTAVDFY